jgi:hypothetical protein
LNIADAKDLTVDAEKVSTLAAHKNNGGIYSTDPLTIIFNLLKRISV